MTWSDEINVAFKKMKMNQTTPPVLYFPEFDQPFGVETDAVLVPFGAFLVQKKEDGGNNPIEFANITMIFSERNRRTSEREMLVVIFAFNKFRVYLLSLQPITVITDQHDFRDAFQKKYVHGRLIRWMDVIAE